MSTWECGHHPVDLALAHERVLPALRDDEVLGSLLVDAERVARVRQRARAWALRLAKLDVALPRFDLDVHLRGRPFFVEADSVDELTRAIEALEVAGPAEVDELVRASLAHFDDDATAPLLNDSWSPVESAPDARDAEALLARVQAVRALLDDASAAPRCAPLLLAVTCELHDRLRPGWRTTRGPWPTRLLTSFGEDPSRWFESPAALVAPLLNEHPELAEHLSWTTLGEDGPIGGFVPIERVADLRATLEARADQMERWARDEGWAEDVAVVHLRLLREALAVAERRGFAFVETVDL
ncbi:MAG: hypothetical protein AAF533_16440 [Acidobacteriota bacterium]